MMDSEGKVLSKRTLDHEIKKAGPSAKHPWERLHDIFERIQIKLFTVFIRRQFGFCGKGVVVEPPFKYKNLQYIWVGDSVMIKHYSWIHAIGNIEQITGPVITLKANCHIGMGVTIAAVRSVVLEENVLIARNVYISDHGHSFEDINTPIMDQGIRNISPVTVGKNSWIGQNACVMPGVTIGRHCVIGANSVVTRDLPDYSVAVGSPARVIKRYNETTCRWEKLSGRAESTT
jgi:acetyltransferase-like isoleucine patch superfamily enzyme